MVQLSGLFERVQAEGAAGVAKLQWFIKAPTMNECEEARGLRSFAFQKDSNYSKNLLERSV